MGFLSGLVEQAENTGDNCDEQDDGVEDAQGSSGEAGNDDENSDSDSAGDDGLEGIGLHGVGSFRVGCLTVKPGILVMFDCLSSTQFGCFF
jgi:hypothetical protein